MKIVKCTRKYIKQFSLCHNWFYAFTEYFAQCGTAYALFRLAFTVAPSFDLTLLTKVTRWIVLQKARRHRTSRLRLLVGTEFQDLFHSPPGVLFTFPSLYLFTIDRILCLALAGGPAGFNQDFSCPGLLEKTNIRSTSLSCTRLSRCFTELSNSFH